MSEWKLAWNETEDRVIFREIEEDKVITEFALAPPSHAKLYYALKDWYGDK